MGLPAYYIQVDADQLQAIHDRPAIVWNIRNDPKLAKSALVDVEKDWETLAWLVSAQKRKEVERRKLAGVASAAEPAGEASSTADPLLDAIEGRGTEQQRDPAIAPEPGKPAPRVFTPAEVKAIAAAFNKASDDDLFNNFDRKAMTRSGVGGMDWTKEADSIFDEYLLPGFKALGRFYQRAAAEGKYVVVLQP